MIKHIALYGGSFDPPHIAHLRLIRRLITLTDIDEVWLMPCGDREDKKLIMSKDQRFNLMKKLFKQSEKVKVI